MAYLIYPVKGKAARDYLERLGCRVSTHIMSIPAYLKEVPTSDNSISSIVHDGAGIVAPDRAVAR
jgi:hypothetical protein